MKRLREYVVKRLGKKRFLHSLGVEETARHLAVTFGGAHPHAAATAGLLHDIARYMSDEELLQEARLQGIMVREIDKRAPILLHGKVGAAIVKKELGIEDAQILRAISSHVTGQKGWSMLDKIVYLVDKCEPSRDYPGVQEIRGILEKGDFSGALIKALELSIQHSYDSNPGSVDPETAVVLSEESQKAQIF